MSNLYSKEGKDIWPQTVLIEIAAVIASLVTNHVEHLKDETWPFNLSTEQVKNSERTCRELYRLWNFK